MKTALVITFIITLYFSNAAGAAVCQNSGYCHVLTSPNTGGGSQELAALFNTNDPPEKIFAGLFNFLLSFVGVGALVMIVVEGIRYMASAGDQSKIGESKRKIWNAVWGLILALISFLLLQTINPDLLKPGLKSIDLNKQSGLLDPGGYRDVARPPEINKDINVIFSRQPADISKPTKPVIDSLRKECESKGGILKGNTPLGGGIITYSCVIPKN